MKKKKKKNKKTDGEAILARAEKLFDRGNYPMALKEFRKAQGKLSRVDLSDKIAVCRERAREMEAKEAIRLGRKAEKKGNLRTALKHFEDASAISREEWLGPRIRQLKERLEGKSAAAAARKAEAAGDFKTAADLYARADDKGESGDLSRKTARALVKAQKYADAAAHFEILTEAGPADLYDHGLALAMCGRYVECLAIWRKIESDDEGFAEQRLSVCRRLAVDLFDRFELKKDPASIFRDATSLLKLYGSELPPAWRTSLDNLRQYTRYEWIEELWSAGDFETISGLLEPDPPPDAPAPLGLRAKAWFNLAAKEPRRIPSMMMYWMSAVYSCPISASGDMRKKARQKLVEAAERLIREAGRSAAERLKIEGRLLPILLELREKGKNKDGALYTPLFAAHLNKSGEMLALIRKNRSFFTDNDRYIETGAYYSTLGASLFLYETGEVDAAEKSLADAPEATGGTEFDDYSTKRVYFEYAAHSLEKGAVGFNHYFDSAPELFEKSPDLEKRFTQRAIDAHDPDVMKAYEDALSHIHGKRATGAITEALSLVMSQRAILRYNRDEMGLKALHATLKRALKLNPENETARMSLQKTSKIKETKKVMDAINRGKLGRASRIARDSENPEVRDRYFEFVEDLFEDLVESDLPHEEQLLHLNDIYDWAYTVDPQREVVARMHEHLNVNA